MAEQPENPFDDFKPSWLEKKPKSVSADPNSFVSATNAQTAEDILLQEVVLPLQSNQTLQQPNRPSENIQPVQPSPVAKKFIYEPEKMPVTSNKEHSYNPTVEISNSSTIALPPTPNAISTYKSKISTKGNLLFWLLGFAGIIVFLIILYAILLVSQDAERQTNNRSPLDFGDISHFPNSHSINLDTEEAKPFETRASIALTKINKEACYSSTDSAQNIQLYFENLLSVKKYTPFNIAVEGKPQTEAWRGRNDVGVVLSVTTVGYFDFGYFNLVQPNQSIFCLFNGPIVPQVEDASTTPGDVNGKSSQTPLNSKTVQSSTSNSNTGSTKTKNPDSSLTPTPTVISTHSTNNSNSTKVVPTFPPSTPTPVNPLDLGA